MRRTLLFIPHEIAGLPVFGLGWLLLLLILAACVRLVLVKRRGDSFSNFFSSEGFVWGLFTLIIVLLLPMVELKNIDGEPVGMAIRGYGVMLLIGVCSAVALAVWRATRRGIDGEHIFGMAPWVFVGGIVGARLFYVIQYHNGFFVDSIAESLRRILTFTEGGLVVYGGFIGGFLVGAFYIYRHRLPLLKLGDAIVPCMFLGLFFGRIGCLMNGCCYGGQCDPYWASLHFPAGSPVYLDQLKNGTLVGLGVDWDTRKVVTVKPDSLADRAGIEPGSRVQELELVRPHLEETSRNLPREELPLGVEAMIGGEVHQWRPDQLPSRALAVQPAQLISSLSAIGLCAALCALSLLITREGVIMMLGLAGYAVMRFFLEWVRVDEAGQFGTALSISQWVSMVVFGLAVGGFIWVTTRAPGDKDRSTPVVPS